MSRRKTTKDETGAVAVMFALMATVILAMAALAIDVGQVYAKRASLQSAVDQAVLAAAAELDGTNVCTPAAIDAAKKYLVRNWIDQGGDPKVVADIDLTANNVDAYGRGDGYMKCTKWTVELTSPTAAVNLGLAKAVIPDAEEGNDKRGRIHVPAKAVAEVRSPRLAGIPFYATSACSNGRQVLSNDSHGHTTPPPVPLTPSSATLNGATITSISPTSTPTGTAISNLVINGTGFTSTTTVGFTTSSGDHVEVAVGSGATLNSASKITIATVPAGVTNLQDLWYVRVLKGGNWSANDGNATSGVKILTVGDEKLYCLNSTTGNFGSLAIGRTPSPTPSDLIYYNVALGVDHELSTMPGAPSAPNLCAGETGAVTAPIDGQNCVETDTGLPANALEEGMITGTSPPGRLRVPGTSPCTPSNVSYASYSLNDDVLTCFFTDSSVRVGDVSKADYVGEPVISPSIFDSPRFVWVPIIESPPTGKKSVSIQGFKPGFITDQPDTATKSSPWTWAGSGTIPNGFSFQTASGTKVREMRVVFIHPNALPSGSSATGDEVAYRGTGAKVIVLVD